MGPREIVFSKPPHLLTSSGKGVALSNTLTSSLLETQLPAWACSGNFYPNLDGNVVPSHRNKRLVKMGGGGFVSISHISIANTPASCTNIFSLRKQWFFVTMWLIFQPGCASVFMCFFSIHLDGSGMAASKLPACLSADSQDASSFLSRFLGKVNCCKSG